MTKHNISISIGGTNLGDNPSTTMSVTHWVSSWDDYIVLCQKVWQMLTDESFRVLSTDDKELFTEVTEWMVDNGYLEDTAHNDIIASDNC